MPTQRKLCSPCSGGLHVFWNNTNILFSPILFLPNPPILTTSRIIELLGRACTFLSHFLSTARAVSSECLDEICLSVLIEERDLGFRQRGLLACLFLFLVSVMEKVDQKKEEYKKIYIKWREWECVLLL